MTQLESLIYYQKQIASVLQEIAETPNLKDRKNLRNELRLLSWRFCQIFERYENEENLHDPALGVMRAIMRYYKP